jgi:glycosyltransferase involved in cell wall biosynthesis
MKIVFVPPRPFGLAFGGLEIHILQTIRVLEEFGHEASVVDLSDTRAFDGVDLVHFFGAAPAYAEFADLLDERDIPFVVTPIQYPADSRWRVGLKLAAARIPGTLRRLQSRFLHRAALILPNSRAEGLRFHEHWRVPASKIRPVPLGVETSFKGDGPQFVDQYGKGKIRVDEPFVLSVGRIDPRKNTLNLLRAAQHLKVPVILIGAVSPFRTDQQYVSAVLNLVEANSTSMFHIPHIPRRDLPHAYAAAHVHSLVSHMESVGLATMEAGLNGANLVVGRCPPVEEYFSKIAWIVDQNDVRDIASGIRQGFDSPRNFYGQEQYIEQEYSLKGYGERTVKGYREVCSNFPTATPSSARDAT